MPAKNFIHYIIIIINYPGFIGYFKYFNDYFIIKDFINVFNYLYYLYNYNNDSLQLSPIYIIL
jgi:hypothetical protein